MAQKSIVLDRKRKEKKKVNTLKLVFKKVKETLQCMWDIWVNGIQSVTVVQGMPLMPL